MNSAEKLTQSLHCCQKAKQKLQQGGGECRDMTFLKAEFISPHNYCIDDLRREEIPGSINIYKELFLSAHSVPWLDIFVFFTDNTGVQGKSAFSVSSKTSDKMAVQLKIKAPQYSVLMIFSYFTVFFVLFSPLNKGIPTQGSHDGFVRYCLKIRNSHRLSVI